MSNKRDEIGESPAQPGYGVLADLMHKLKKGVLTEDELKLFLKKQNPFAVELDLSSNIPNDQDADEQIANLERFYDQVLNINLVVPKFRLPHPRIRKEFNLALIMSQKLSYDFLWEAMGQRYDLYCYYYSDICLEKLIKPEDEIRSPKNGSYMIWVQRLRECHKKTKGISAIIADSLGINGQTLLEAMFHFIYYDWLIGQTRGDFFDGNGISKITNTDDYKNHLMNQETWSICSGSRFLYGGVPYFGWDVEKTRLYVSSTSLVCPDDNSHLRPIVLS